ncbi:hypothetical protein SAMN04487866_10916 [Thermoactinomyces sp. DSM 45891]|uniref:hypothetical protein n=1 Tax=Thermoactinomyces sp. DSM 45891 TaxID=1761907 RepID=UPI000914AA82|nr:hypothetical protein [Thermoactinomyces sp. DSM 45891]SFX47699.1 hypothetical protein SAMN04487866_10916 [Thermoactinomyces sp. DSM 45891]
MGRFTCNNHQELFQQESSKLGYNRIENRSERIQLIDQLIEEYVNDTGLRPDPRQLERLATSILYEDLQGDRRPDKVAKSRDPILTLAQVKRRHSKEVGSGILEVIGSDGRYYGIDSDRHSGKEMMIINPKKLSLPIQKENP